jgi:hypothetical protein
MEGAADLLQLALNCSNTITAAAAVRHLPATAASAARRMPKLLEPDVAHRLLVTAATRWHLELQKAVTLQQLGYTKQHIDAATLEVMLIQLMPRVAHLACLTQLPAAAHLSSKTVIRLLLAAAASEATHKYRILSGVDVLCQLPAAQQLDNAGLLQLLQAAMQQGRVPQSFCRLPAAQQLSSGEVFQLLQAAVQLGSLSSDMSVLCCLPGARDLDSASVL